MATMSTMNVSLPDDMKAFVEAQVAREGYASVSEYLRAIIRDAQKRKAREELEGKLIEGLQGAAVEMTSEDWQSIEAEALGGLDADAPRS
jgi:antitoxin ParD1/3/4